MGIPALPSPSWVWHDPSHSRAVPSPSAVRSSPGSAGAVRNLTWYHCPASAHFVARLEQRDRVSSNGAFKVDLCERSEGLAAKYKLGGAATSFRHDTACLVAGTRLDHTLGFRQRPPRDVPSKSARYDVVALEMDPDKRGLVRQQRPERAPT